jgi:2-desacetyl-2-hydroxyethyl bacteriochlorophyllide A dehydrogenase
VRLEAVELPEPGPGDVLVETRRSGISVGTERNLVHGEVSWGPFPICTGYQAVGEVERACAETGFEAGDRVYYRDNAELRRPEDASITSASGTHCSKAVADAREARKR